MISLQGSESVHSPPTNVWQAVSDARFLVNCIPGLESVTKADPTAAACRVRPEFTFVRGTLELEIQIEPRLSDRSVRLAIAGRGVGASLRVEAGLTVTHAGDDAQVAWSAQVTEVGGLLKLVSSGLLHGAATKVVGEMLRTARQRLESPPAGP
jgi:carbon monoxide dehydrogenase subunit G